MDTGLMVGRVPATSKHRKSPAEKSEDDVQGLLSLARFVLVLEDNGTYTVVENDPTRKRLVIPIIAVVGQAVSKGVAHQASLLEIGYRRARPYRRVHAQRNQVLLYDRLPFYKLTEVQQKLVYPVLLRCLQTILEEARASWKTTEPWHLPSGYMVERGVQITIDKRDTWLDLALLREHVRYFTQCLFPRYASWIAYNLRYSRFVRYKNYGPSVKKVVGSIVQSSYFQKSTLLLEALLRKLPHKRQLIESALMDLHNFRLVWNPELALVFGDTSSAFASSYPLFFYRTLDQPQGNKGGHAKHCARFEILPDRIWLRQQPGAKPSLNDGWELVHKWKPGDDDAPPPF